MERIQPGRPRRRERNPRGEGAKLRDDLIEAGIALITEHGTADAVSVRAVARHAGVSAPSVYLHFADREALLQEVVTQGFHDLIDAVDAAIADAGHDPSPIETLRAGCRGYLKFGLENPGRYRVVFDTPIGPYASTTSETAGDALGTLVNSIAACQEAGVADAGDPFTLATIVWASMHGFVMLRSTDEAFNWPPCEEVLDRVLVGVLGLREVTSGPKPRTPAARPKRPARRTHE